MQIEDIRHARPRRLRLEEYHRAVEAGFFERERVELIRGIVVEMAPGGPEHADPIDVLTASLVSQLGPRARVRIQLPLICADDSEPEPDVAVVPPGRYRSRHPDRAYLVVEVARTSLAYDRDTKAPLYAQSAVDEYWIADVAGRAIEIHRDPRDGAYRSVERVGLGATVSMQAFPDVTVAVSDLFG